MYKTLIVPRITSSDEKNHRKKNYRSAHIAANAVERKAVGGRRFKELNRKIQRLPKGHWAGTHTSRGNILVSNELVKMYPKKERKNVISQIRVHEITEHRYMRER